MTRAQRSPKSEYGCAPRSERRGAASDLVEIRRGQLERRTADPPVNLRRRSRPDDRSGHPRPCENPRNGHRRNRTAVTPGDRPQRVAEREVAAELRLLKLRAAAPPIVLGERGDPRGAEAVR